MESKALNPCKYSVGIECVQHDKCRWCGWNPKVDKERRQAEKVWEDCYCIDEIGMLTDGLKRLRFAGGSDSDSTENTADVR